MSIFLRKLIQGEPKKFGEVVFNDKMGLTENNRNYVSGLFVMCQILYSVLCIF